VVEPLLRGRFGRPYLYRESVASTQALFDRSEPEGAVAVAEEQTAGRGRLGRVWEAPLGSSILCSVLLRPPAGPALPQLSLVGGLAAAEAVEQALGRAAQIKWPNDVLVGERKVAGVLAEALEGAVVMGIGINVNQRREELPEVAASLREISGGACDRAPLLARLLGRLEHHYERWLEDGLSAVFEGLAERDVLRGRGVSVDGVAGTALGISRSGGLEVDLGGERKTIETGEVTF
jgi:BirA family biotin operon repressor/biotin-[acetyl-CoA-carboxylase] ligase